jgi:hypothetical protein
MTKSINASKLVFSLLNQPDSKKEGGLFHSRLHPVGWLHFDPVSLDRAAATDSFSSL